MTTLFTPAATPRNCHTVAHLNEARILFWLHRFGWLRTADLAQLVWHDALHGDKMAQRTLRRLTAQNEVYTRRLPNGVPAHALTHHGAMRIAPQIPGAKACHALKRSLAHYAHRNLCNEFVIARCIDLMHRGHHAVRPFTEYEVQTFAAPLKSAHDKIPDALVEVTEPSDSVRRMNWVEVERAWKRDADYQKLLDFIRITLVAREPYLAPGIVLDRLLVVAESPAHFERLGRALAADTHRTALTALTALQLRDLTDNVECHLRQADGSFVMSFLDAWIDWNSVKQ